MAEVKQEEEKVISGYAFHVHHDILVEYCTDYQERVDYIMRNKPRGEMSLRLRLFKMISVDRLPHELLEARVKMGEACQKWDEAYQKWDEARQKLGEAYQKWDEACQKWDEARQKWGEAYQKYLPYLVDLHKELCPNCPWDGETIFSKEVK